MLKLTLRLLPLFTRAGWSLYYFIDTLRNGEEAGYLTKPVFYVIAVLGLVIFVRELARWRRKNDRALSASDRIKLAKTAVCVTASVIYLALLPHIGFLLATALFLCAGFIWLGAKKLQAVLVGVLLSGAVYGIFKYVLTVPLFSGPWGF